MGGTKKEVAERAAVDTDFIDRLIELDVLTPEGDTFSAGDVRRARLLKSLEQAGIPGSHRPRRAVPEEGPFSKTVWPIWAART